ncbi:flagellar protein FliT [Aciduricibacillus chroicocephali]|uniref:Flagellar protein FliT n=1 Tax=Aciduricibacillus chroicocephali TaxID=3054939 RepID=A0ABY9KTV4_9BACI|nr:flagellar protein FliT [Bacillaceae bacterium 44XB]
MNRLKVIMDVSKKLDELLHSDEHADDRDILISKATELIEERGVLMAELQPPFTEEETNMGKELIPLNTRIEVRMTELFEELKREMKDLKQQKRSKQQYKNPYRHVASMDGMYVDSKK